MVTQTSQVQTFVDDLHRALVSIPLEDEDHNLSTRTTESDSSSNVEPIEYLNGNIDARTIHLYNLHDDPSSSEEEQCDDENMYVAMLYKNPCCNSYWTMKYVCHNKLRHQH